MKHRKERETLLHNLNDLVSGVEVTKRENVSALRSTHFQLTRLIMEAPDDFFEDEE